MTHLHLTALVLTSILFAITVSMQIQGRDIKLWKMGLRASYILVIASGLLLFFGLYKITALYIVKSVVGILIFGLFEMVIIRKEKGKSVNPIWIVFAVTFAGLLYLGFKLPLGLYYF